MVGGIFCRMHQERRQGSMWLNPMAYRFYLLTQCFGLCVGSLLNLTRNSNNGGTKSRGFVVGALEWEYQREHTVLLGFIVLLSRSLSALCVKLRAGTISIQNT
ncbi:uncharacterized protein [Primulina eburnea]|uniref:uncharacterized protein isoform X3 n=1 Tax=Primulina eburnea TaxID=1245227 RepID=UPI003C6BEF63